MPRWIPLPAEKLYHQPDQTAFLTARRERNCPRCRQVYQVVPPVTVCPKCAVEGVRRFDRLTIIAGRRWGKSRIGAIAGADEATIPNSVGWCCAPTNPKLHRYVIPAFQQLIPEDWVAEGGWNAEFKDLRLKNGSLIHFQTLEDPDQGRGQGLDWLWIDEVCELTKAHWEVIRPSLAGNTVAFFTTSPRGYDWVYKELYKPAEENVSGYWACHAKTAESANPRITADFLAREKAQMSDTMYRQEYEADFVIFAGAVYGNLINPQILRTNDEVRKIIPEWPGVDNWRQVLVGIDTGADHPFGAVKLIAAEGGFVIVDEYLERHRTFVQHANAIKAMSGSPNTKWAINKNERQPMLELAQHNIYCQKAENEIVAGTERVKNWLHAKQLWFVESKVPKTIQQMQAYRWADPPDDGKEKRLREKVYKLEDELPDCIRYALMTWPTLPVHKEPDANAPRDLSHFSDEVRASIKRMRKLDADPTEEKPETVTGDFWT